MVESETKAVYKQVGQTGDAYYYDINSKPLGAGAFGTVYKGYSANDSNEEVAIKVISKATLTKYSDFLDTLLREVEILKKIKGKHLLGFKTVIQTSSNLYIITTFCNGGNLETKLALNKGPLTETDTLKIIKQMAEAFIEVDELGLKNARGEKQCFMHRDIKPANILFHNGEVCLADFGFGKLVDESIAEERQPHTTLGSFVYMSPQILKEEAYTIKCDVWSTGVVAYQLLHGRVPYSAPSQIRMVELINTKTLEFAPGLSKDTVELITQMLQVEEDKRPSWREILAHPALKPKKPKITFIEDTIAAV